MLPLFHSSFQKYHFEFLEMHTAAILLTLLNTPRSFTTLFVLHWPFLWWYRYLPFWFWKTGAPLCFCLVGLYWPRYCAHLAAAAPVAPRMMGPEQQWWGLEASLFFPWPSVRNNDSSKTILLNKIVSIDHMLKECNGKWMEQLYDLHKQIYHTVNSLRSFLSSGHPVT